ncbi:MAG: hypothetical protein LBV55_00950 [Acholeplasmatales bacterium]|jgi:hypothetical protein|nr:hypothetical protein [Acholeplasmatales bacterium]
MNLENQNGIIPNFLIGYISSTKYLIKVTSESCQNDNTYALGLYDNIYRISGNKGIMGIDGLNGARGADAPEIKLC